MRQFVASLTMVALFVSTTGCAHSVIIDSDPTGADIKVNGEKIGTAPVTYNETTGWEKIYDVEASKAGYRPTKKQVKQTEWNVPIVIASVGGFVLLWWALIGLVTPIGLLWSRQLPDRVVVSLEKGGGGGGGGQSGGSDAPSYGY
jgi:PEGA domain